MMRDGALPLLCHTNRSSGSEPPMRARSPAPRAPPERRRAPTQSDVRLRGRATLTENEHFGYASNVTWAVHHRLGEGVKEDRRRTRRKRQGRAISTARLAERFH
jgi:hypothetical protein